MPSTTRAIRSERLDLVPMSPAFLVASLEGRRAEAAAVIGAELPADWPGDGARVLRRRLRQLEADPAVQPWLLRAIVLRQPRRMVGHIGFHEPPDAAGRVEVGYAVQPADRRRGYALEAVQAMLGWAGREHGVRRFVASISPGNGPSLALVRKLGFEQVGTQWDADDGEELVFELDRGGMTQDGGLRPEADGGASTGA